MKARCATAFLILLTFLTPAHALAQTSPVPRFEDAACPFTVDPSLTEGQDIRCGYLIVPQNRSVPASATIRLAVAILKSPIAHPAPDPLIFLTGGPGQGLLGSNWTIRSRDFWARDRDLILIDQRGTGFSQPSLQCPEVGRMFLATLQKHVTLAREDALEAQAFARCRSRLVGQDVDLSAYNSIENARDIADLRTALGYSRVNLYGISYGTRLALTVMRYFPEGLRSVVLNSVYGPTVNVFTDPQRSAARLFDRVFAGCQRTASCRSRYPHLQRDFSQVVQRLDKKPVNMIVQGPNGLLNAKATGEVVANILFFALYDARGIPAARDAIFWAARRHYSLLENMAAAFVILNGSDIISQGMNASVECSEDAPGTTQADIDTSARALPAFLRKDFAAQSKRGLHDCQVWNVPAVSPAQKQPVVSAVPTMILEGQDDPITPPAYGAEVAKTLSSSFSFLYPGEGHGVSSQGPCPFDMIWTFLDNPAHKPNDSCIASLREP